MAVEERSFSYIIFDDAGTIKAVNSHTGEVDYSGVDPDTVINDTIDEVNTAGGGIILLKEATYTINNPIIMKSNVTLMGEGFSTIITLANTSNINVIECTGSPSSITVRDLKIVGNKANQGSQGTGIYWVAVTDALIDNVWITDCLGQGINIVNGSTDVLIQNCRVETCAVAIYVFASTESNHRVIISNCIVDTNTSGIYSVGSASYYNFDIIVEHCIVKTSSTHGILYQYTQRGVITGCIAWGTTTWNGIFLQRCYYITVTGCTVYNNNDCGIILNWSRRCTVSSNVCWGNGNYGILLNSNTDCDRNIVHGNISYSNARGLVIGTGCDDNVVNDNNIWDNTIEQWWNGGARNITNDNKIG